MRVLSPVGRVPGAEAVSATWTASVTGRTIGFISNGKPNSAELLRLVEQRVKERFNIQGTVWANKSEEAQGASYPATEQIYTRLSSGAIAVLAASGD